MSWGKELWDQGDNIALHTKKGIEFLERYSGFIGERLKIENEYARQLKLLVSKYMPKKRDEDDCQFTYRQSFVGILKEVNDMANQHETIAERFRDDIVNEISHSSKRLKDQRKDYIDESQRLQSQLNGAIESMKKSAKEYSRAFKESEAAQSKFHKAEADMNLSRAEVEKAKNNSITKTQQAELAKNSYALQLQQTNELQREYYTRALPSIYEKLRELDESRIGDIRRLMEKCVEIERNVLPIVQRCLDGMLEQAHLIDPSADSATVVNRYKTGYAIPEDFPFDDLSAEGSSAGSGETANGGSSISINSNGLAATHSAIPASPGGNGPLTKKTDRKGSTGGTLARVASTKRSSRLTSLFRSKNDELIKDDFADLPPQQRCSKLSQRIACIEKNIDTKIAQKDGLAKMQMVYEDNPKLGDVEKVKLELLKCDAELAALDNDLRKYQELLREASSHLNLPMNAVVSPSVSGSSSVSPTSTPSSSARGPPPNRPPPPTVSPSFQNGASSGYNKQRNSTGEAGAGRTGSELSTGGQDRSKSRTPTPQPAQSNNGYGSRISMSASQTKDGKTVGEARMGAIAALSSAALAQHDDYDEWTSADNGVEDEYENQASDATSSTGVVLGTCKALYDFTGGSDGMLPMKEGEEMLLLERDAGDGWTKIRKERGGGEEGFVPTSYLDCRWYPD